MLTVQQAGGYNTNQRLHICTITCALKSKDQLFCGLSGVYRFTFPIIWSKSVNSPIIVPFNAVKVLEEILFELAIFIFFGWWIWMIL